MTRRRRTPMVIGKEIQKARRRLGFTQRELASLLDVSPETVRSWEGDRIVPQLDTFALLCVVLEVTPNGLLRIDGKKGKPE